MFDISENLAKYKKGIALAGIKYDLEGDIVVLALYLDSAAKLLKMDVAHYGFSRR